MGRVLYEEWAKYWPEHAEEEFGDVMNGIKKYVVSSSSQTFKSGVLNLSYGPTEG